MRAVMRNVARSGGFTAVEATIVVAIVAVLASVGIPSMSAWLLNRKAQAATSYYADGIAFARSQAIARNSATRLVLDDHAATGQQQWRVDFCYPSTDSPCDDDSTGWSTTTTAAAADPRGASGDRSIVRSANGLPSSSTVSLTVAPSGADAVYFTPLGWVDSRVTAQISRITLSPSVSRSGAFEPMAVSLTLAGAVMRCNPSPISPTDRRRCPR